MACKSIAHMERQEAELIERAAQYRSNGYHSSALVLEDRLDRLQYALGVARGKVLVTPSKTSHFRDSKPHAAP